MMYGHDYVYGFSPFHAIGTIFMAFFWLFFILVVIKVLRNERIHVPWTHSWRHENAMDIIKERYAKGEITKEQFHEMKKELEG